MYGTATYFFNHLIRATAIVLVMGLFTTTQATAQVTAFKQSVAEAAARDDDLSEFYRTNNYEGIWTGTDRQDQARRQALLQAIGQAKAHGLPEARYEAEKLIALMKAAKTPRDLGRVEVEMSRTFLLLARDMQTGVLVPSEVDNEIKRERLYRNRVSYLTDLTESTPKVFFRELSPKAAEYGRLMKEKIRLEALLAKGGWGAKVPAKSLKPGASGPAVVALRNRLIKMGFLSRSSSKTYDDKLAKAVQSFQGAHGLVVNGEAGARTINAINITVESRIKSIIVAMERERWMNFDRGDRHVLVNLPDFSTRIIDYGKVTFQTRSVVGKNAYDRRSPEFSDEMEHMVINPTWHVPRSIAVKEYLPQMQRNSRAVSYLKMYNSRGQEVSRSNINFRAYNASNFPYFMKQPPSNTNALGLVKFMLPNKYNIYLHDSPAKKLFEANVRAFSHGCIRLQRPFEFAYAILAKQESNPKEFFQSNLNSGERRQVNLETKIPVHIIYRTAFTQAKGPVQYRDDVYGRDAKIWKALNNAGVSLNAVQS